MTKVTDMSFDIDAKGKTVLRWHEVNISDAAVAAKIKRLAEVNAEASQLKKDISALGTPAIHKAAPSVAMNKAGDIITVTKDVPIVWGFMFGKCSFAVTLPAKAKVAKNAISI